MAGYTHVGSDASRRTISGTVDPLCFSDFSLANNPYLSRATDQLIKWNESIPKEKWINSSRRND